MFAEAFEIQQAISFAAARSPDIGTVHLADVLQVLAQKLPKVASSPDVERILRKAATDVGYRLILESGAPEGQPT